VSNIIPPCTPVFIFGEILAHKPGAVLFIFGGAEGKEAWIAKASMRSWSTERLGATAVIEVPYHIAELLHLLKYQQNPTIV